VPSYTLEQLASATCATLVGDGTLVVSGLASLQDAGPGQLSFFAKSRYLERARTSSASALIVPEDFAADGGPALLKVPDPYAAYAVVAALFEERETPPVGVHPSSVLGPGVRLGEGVSVGPHAVLSEGVCLGDDACVGAGCFLGRGVRVGAGTRLSPGVKLLAGTSVGERCIVHSGTVVGADGFGYATSAAGHRKIPQLGRVRIEDDVEIGANCTVDRGSLGDTRIGRGTKIDNLVHVAHNVDVGEEVLIVAQVGISGSTRIGDRAVLAGQVGLAGHIEIGAGAKVAAQSGVSKSVPAGEEWFGYPARERRRAFRLNALYAKLPELYERLERLEARLEGLVKPEESP
jgi:UDP-3-O-[3-hydroxymyristoyl] glucosamine N-acyltransferase